VAGNSHNGDRAPEQSPPRREPPVAARRRRGWLVVAAVALSAWTAGLLAAGLWRHPDARPPDLESRSDVAGLPVPKPAADLHPQYRALVEESAEVACQLVESFPSDAWAVAALASLHNLAHDDAAEATCWQRCLALEAGFSPAYHHLALRAMDRGEYERAEALLREALSRDPSNAEFAGLLAEALMNQGRLEESIEVLERLAAANTASPENLLFLGQMYLQTKENEKAKARFERALALEPGSARAYSGLATACARLGDQAEAERYRARVEELKSREDRAARGNKEALSDARVVPPCVAKILGIAGKVYLAHGQFGPAEEHLLRAAELDPSNPEFLEALAGLYDQVGRLGDAARVVEQIQDLEPWNLVHRRNLGILQARMNEPEAAEATFRELCAIAPDRAVGYAGLAELFLRAGEKLAEAKVLAATAVRLEPTAWHYFILAAICEKSGDDAGSRKAMERAAALDPGNPRYRAPYPSNEPYEPSPRVP
jgi:Flp pilus assembly protein TadD